MRISPMGIWCHKLPNHVTASFAILDNSLSHQSKQCTDAAACYSIAISHLINNLGDRQGKI